MEVVTEVLVTAVTFVGCIVTLLFVAGIGVCIVEKFKNQTNE